MDPKMNNLVPYVIEQTGNGERSYDIYSRLYGFGEKNREGDEYAGGDIDDDEGRSAVFAANVGEPPDVAKTDGRAGHGHDDHEVSAEFFPCLCHAI